MNSMKRISAVLLAVLMAVSLIPGSALAKVFVREAETIAAWDFEAQTPNVTTASANNTGAVVARNDSSIAFSYTQGSGGTGTSAISSNGWDGASEAAPKYYTVTVNAVGYSGIGVSAKFRASNTGPKNVALYYSVNGADFIAVDGATTTLTSSSYWGTAAGTLPAACDGAESLEIRMVVNDTAGVNGSAVQSGGTLRMDDLTITGTAEGGTDPTPVPTTVPTDPPFVTISIAEALNEAIGNSVCVGGTVTFIDGRNVYIQDETAGIVLYLNANTVPAGLALGDIVAARGTRADYKGLPEVSGIDGSNSTQFTVLSSGNPLPCEQVTIADINANNAEYVCERVLIKGAVLGTINNSGNTPITQGEDVINIYKLPAIDFVEGDTVDVIAVVGMFNSVQLRVAAAEDVTAAEVLEPVEGTVTIAEALAAAVNTENICVAGIVTFIDGRNIYIEDDTGAIDVYLNSGTVPAGLNLGDRVKATGKRADYKGLPELSGVDGSNAEAFSVISTGHTLPEQQVTIAELLANTDNYICERVTVKEAIIGAINTSGNTTLTQGEASTVIYKIPAVDAVEGNTVNVTAVVGMFNTMQLRVALASDVTVVGSTEPTPAPTAAPTTGPVDPVDDPIDPADYPGLSTIAQILAGATGGEATVVGQVTFKFGNFGDLNSILLGDVENGEIIGLQIYDQSHIGSYNVGDIVSVKGTVGDYGGVRQLSNVSEVSVLNTETAPMEAQEVTIPELKNNIANYLSEYVVIKGAVLGAYSSSGSTNITDAEGNTMPIYRAAAYPDGVVEGDTVDVYAAASKYNANVQLRNGASTDYVADNASYITIAEALALELNASATVRGVVTFIDGRNVYVQDSTAGIDLYLNNGTVPEALAIGDLVEATGARAEFRGLPELSGIDGASEEAFKIISSGNGLPLEKVTLAQLTADPAAYMCERIKVEAVTLGAINNGGSTPITQDGVTVNVYRLPQVDFTEGDVVDMIAIVSSYNAVQLRVVEAGDVTAAVVFNDPVTDDMFTENDMTIPQVIAAADNAEVTVVAQLVYRFGNYSSINSAILEDIVDGEIWGLQMYNSLDDYQLGDILRINATKTTYGGVPQIQSPISIEKIGEAERIPAQPFDTFADLNANRDNLLSEYVMVRSVTLGAYNDNGNTVVTDSTGSSMNIYRAYPYDPFCVTAGEVVDLCAALSKYSTTWQFRGGEYFGENKAPVIELGSFLNAEVGVDYPVAIAVTDDYGIDNVVCRYEIGETVGELTMTYNPTNTKYQAIIPGSEITAGHANMNLTFTATDTSGLTAAAAASVQIVDQPQIEDVLPRPNSSTYDDKAPEIKVVFTNAGEDPTVVITVDGVEGQTAVEGNTASFIYAGELADAKYTAHVTITRTDGASTEYSWTFTVGEPQFGFYFGQLHAHTAEYSDGAGTIEDAYSYVTGLPESENVDFVALTDHSNYFDNKENLGDFEDVESGIIAANGHSKWYNYTTTIDDFNLRQNRVIFLGGYEMTWSGQYGHINTFNSTGIVSRQNSIYTVHGGAGLVAYYDLIKQHPETIHQFNHPGTTFGNFDNFGYYDVAADRVITMVEVGNGEGAVGGSAYWPSYEQYTLALDMGWHVAPTNNQDNHKGRWGNANTARDVILTDNFSEEGIYEAMRNMTIYATEDKNLEIFYSLNDCIMGTIIPDNDEDPIEAVHVYISVNDPDGEGIGLVNVVCNGNVSCYADYIDGASGVIDVTLPNDYSYYFVRVTQPDGDIAVTAPVWVGDVSKVGISDVTTETIIPVKDEEMTFTTTLYDYEAEDFTITTISYEIAVGQNDPVVVGVFNDQGVVTANTERQFTFNFTPTALGKQKLLVTVYGYLGETLMVFTHAYEMDVLDPSELLDIGIDAGHANFYVAGNYAGSDAAFIELCAKNAIRANYVYAGEMTYENIKDYVLLVLTVPYVGWQNVGQANLYTEAEIEAIAQYAANGGNLIVCSKSDRGDPENAAEQAAVITNAILEAVGTDTTVARGIVVDNVRKDNEAYRLHFVEESNYSYTWNGEPVWLLEDVLETTNNSFSGYNSAPVIPGANAIPVIKGYDTTWGASYSDNFTGSNYEPNYETDTVVVPMGEVVEMTLEDLPGGGWLITSGVTFFSTFEVQVEIENATTLQNSNYQIVMNIINRVIPEPVITPIADVNAGTPGQKYTVEGYVTSNASGYDQDTAFFDCIYIQDDTAGINLFPVAGDFHIGQYVRATGVLGAYNGERELVVTNIELVEGHDEMVIEPLELSAEDAMSPDYTGMLVKIKGAVTEVGYSSDGALETIMVQDATGTARVFIDGYIMSEYILDIRVGDRIEATGLASVTVDTEDPDGGFIPRLRVRNRAEVIVTLRLPDINGDGVIDTADALAILRYALGIEEYPPEIVALMDVYEDGVVDSTDALIYLRCVMGIM